MQHKNRRIHFILTFSPKVIIFVGTVGAGKSTQMKLLSSALKSNGLKVKVTFIKTGHILAYLLESLLARMLVAKRRDVYPIRALIEDKSFIFKKLFRFWLILDMLSVSIRFLFSVFLPLKMGRVVLVEEYIPASIADYVYLSRDINFPIKNILFVVNYMLRLLHVCNPVSTIFLDADDFCLVDRWRRRKSPIEVSDYLKMQRTLLFNLSKNLSDNFLYVDTTNKTIEEVHKLIVIHLNLCK
ncbi:MAG: hypothetical protein QXZ08_03580 [Nitrososphaeria archaeon]